MLHDPMVGPRDFSAVAFADEAALRLALSFAKASATIRDEALVARGVLRAFEHDLIYALLKHRHWRKTALFKDVLDDHLCREYGLPRAVVELLSGALLIAPGDAAPELTRPSLVPSTDDEFVRYVCVASATASSEGELATELGLGDQLFKRIKDTMRWLSQGGEGGPSRFASVLDAQIADVLCGLSKELKDEPTALWAHRLRYLMNRVEEPWGEALLGDGSVRMLRFLLSLGKRGEQSTKQVAPKLARLFPDLLAATPVAITEQLLKTLCRVGLVQPADDLRRREGGETRWRLMPLGEELTAEAFARNLLNSGRYGDEEIRQLPSAYQSQLFRMVPSEDAAPFKRWMEELRPLSDAGLAALLQRISEFEGARGAAEVVEKLFASEGSTWVRLAACHAIHRSGAWMGIGQSLVRVAESDASSAVRTAALRASLTGLAVSKV